MKNKSKTKLIIFTLLVIIFTSLNYVDSKAIIPKTLPVQGRLLDKADKPLPDGTYNITIRLYKSNSTGETALYEEKDKLVEIKGGVFSTSIGELTNNPLPEFNQNIWMSIQIGSDKEIPQRIKLGSVPFSLQSQKSEESYHSILSDTAKYVAENPLPLGTIQIYAGKRNKLPSGWMFCEGQALSSEDYQDLYNVLGTSWGGSSAFNPEGEPVTLFQLPDLRGQFLRGVDMKAGNDPDANGRKQYKPGGNAGDSVGSFQAAIVLGDVNNPANFSSTTSFSTDLVAEVPQDSQFGPSGTNSTTTEMRPINVYVFYIIKVRR